MTEPTYEPMDQVERPAGGGIAGAFGPEALAAVLSIVVVVALLGSRLAFSGAGTGTSSPSPIGSSGPAVTPDPGARLQVVVGTLLQIDAILADKRKDLADELKATPFVLSDVRLTMQQINQQLPTAKRFAAELSGTPQGAVLGADLGAVYADLDVLSTAAVRESITFAAAKYRTNAENLIKILDRLPPLDVRLGAMASGLPDPNGSAPPPESPSVVPSESPVPSPSTVPTPIPTPTPTTAPPTQPPSTPPPSVPGSPTPSPGPNPLVNPGFEQGVGPPWQLVLSGNAQASPSADSQLPHAGKISARIDITVPGAIPWISLQQGGLTIEAGSNYNVSLWARSTAPRQIRVRITGPTGQVLGNGSYVASIGPAWSVVTFSMQSIVQTSSAVLAIDVGGSAETVWLDDVSISRGSPGP